MINLPYILAHFIGDFLLQSDWQAVNKKKSNYICFVHIFIYMLPFLLVEITWIQFLLVGIQHYIQDRSKFISWYCKIIGSFQGELKQNTLPWGHVITDQIFHIIWMWIVFNYIK